MHKPRLTVSVAWRDLTMHTWMVPWLLPALELSNFKPLAGSAHLHYDVLSSTCASPSPLTRNLTLNPLQSQWYLF